MRAGRSSIGESILTLFVAFCTYAAIGVLLLTLGLLIVKGGAVVDWRFLTAAWQHREITQGGIAQAIIGSALLGIGVIFFSFPVGIATSVFMTEYSRYGRFKRIVQLAIRNLAGVPSVVYGLFGLAVFVYALDFGMSLFSAVLTLSIMTLPWIITASVEALESVPQAFRESSLALGASLSQTILRVVLPAALPGSITGGVIGVARALGETAPLIMVGATFYLSTLPRSPFDRFMALPYHTFILATQHSSPQALSYAAGSALVLIALTFFLTFGAMLLRYRFRMRKDW